jgi:hypothetical protein
MGLSAGRSGFSRIMAPDCLSGFPVEVDMAYLPYRVNRYYSAASAYASSGAHVQARFRSPYTLSTRFTGGQYLLAATQGSGNAACVRE